ncbi:E3 ubiquitin-protein ligase TRIM45-like [Diadema setosum]|uniref:E3 ubiquitin-protein ligase TRIM45-like n=1 Tax=Diadema setosum TaxID=31175 RepID=UPI003B3A4CD3
MATFHQISSKNLECSICLSLFDQPKLLKCSHTFCKDCLESILHIQPKQQTITCPVCRKRTPLPSGDVDKLQTNVPMSSLVEEVKNKNPQCTVCEMDEKPPAVSFCQDCGKYMCKSCEETHSGRESFATHSMIPIDEKCSEDVPCKRRRQCAKHPNYDEDCFCTGCRVYVCSTCGVIEHLQDGHKLEEATIHEDKIIRNIRELKERVKSKKATIENHIKVIETQRNEVTIMLKNLNDDIDKTFEEYMQVLSDRREVLKCQVKRWSEKIDKELKVMDEESRQTISHMNGMEELVTNGTKVPLEKDALIAHDTLCENLKSFLGRDDPDDQSPRGVTERAQKISFRRCVKVDELCLGELKDYTWDVKADVQLGVKSSMNCITSAPDGKMAVGSEKGGIHLYSPDGELQQIVLKDVRVANIGFLSDGRSVVRDKNNKMVLYTPQWGNLDVTFETMSFDEGGPGGLTLGRDDNIYVGYMKLKNIQVFIPQGGKAVREITCDGYSPQQFFSFPCTTGKLLLTDSSTVVCLDDNGKKENVLKKKSMFPLLAICRDDSVIVAWVRFKEDLVSIDRYTRDLGHLSSIITDFKIQKPMKRNWYYLQEFESGEIAFCTSDRLYIFEAK